MYLVWVWLVVPSFFLGVHRGTLASLVLHSCEGVVCSLCYNDDANYSYAQTCCPAAFEDNAFATALR